MTRRIVVISLMLVGFALIIWAGISNYHVRRNQKIAAVTPPGQQLILTPDGGTATPSPDAAPGDGPPNALLGKPAPEFKLVDTAGKEVSLASFRGRPVLVNFWATWCGPCKYEIPWLAELQTKYAGQGFQILGVSSDNLSTGTRAAGQKAAIAAAAQKLHINYPVLLGGDALSDQYGGIDYLPQSFYIDRKGTVVAVITGAGSKNEAEAAVKKAIASGA